MNAIEIYERASGRLERGQTTIGEFEEAIAVLKDVEPVVHARWKKTYDLIDGHDGYECSACGHVKYFDHYSDGIRLCTPYCGYCGARM